MVTSAQDVSRDTVARAVAGVPDPEIPVLTIEDLGILRAISVDEGRRLVEATITPTYSGCPAMAVIEDGIRHAAHRLGYHAEVTTSLSPAWTTDWMTEAGRTKLREFGIAPPERGARGGAVSVTLQRRRVECPQCGSDDTEELAHFGSTACKALRRCRSCGEPFDEFKAI